MDIKKIAAIGPESTGKSSLCEHLAKHYHTTWCPEFAREYLLKNGMDYTFDELLTIAKGQIALEDECLKDFAAVIEDQRSTANPPHPSPIFIDTEMYVMKVWCEFVFDNCHRFILDQVIERKYDLYLLCNTELPWVKDELREYPDLESRQKLFHIYKDIMINQSTPWVEIAGESYDERLKGAIDAVDNLLKGQ